jgi:multicomponent Na+:H+ antiporter subunit F
MSEWYWGLAIFLILNLMAGLFRIRLGPTHADRMLAVQLFGTTGVAILLLLAQAMHTSAFRDVALIFALLTAVSTVTFVRRVWGGTQDKEEHS